MRQPAMPREILPVDEFLALYTRRRLVLDRSTGKFFKVNSCICVHSRIDLLCWYFIWFTSFTMVPGTVHFG